MKLKETDRTILVAAIALWLLWWLTVPLYHAIGDAKRASTEESRIVR